MISSFERIKSQVNSAVMMVRRIHLFPFRTQKLSFVTPRVVRGTPLARVGSLTSVFGMGTGVSFVPSSPHYLLIDRGLNQVKKT